MSRHLDPEFWSEVMRESRVAVTQIARQATETGTFDASVVGKSVNEAMDRYDTTEEKAAAMNLWAQSAIGMLSTTLNSLAQQRGYKSFDELQTMVTLEELLNDE
ncbi:hypothetical protein ITJ66_05880 [Plantibacter sp. VKM Ac-2885]|uniref:hypothetical protein n=1 Tax=Plantibacter sp. VKM Ac-2885 TaxID=2783828 RepID=UPI00188C4FDA|nr:hypothetical protein [Plantibacter sp. VKM Ac-2885]MBF4512014.1 hypothetical protein [Plantibacter sp. VKM Ac-2885]